MSTTHMDPAVVEKIVQEVIRRLLERGVGVVAESDSSQAEPELRIEDRLVTLATLQGRLNGVESVRVGHRAVVTPAVIDELTDHGITLVRE